MHKIFDGEKTGELSITFSLSKNLTSFFVLPRKTKDGKVKIIDLEINYAKT